MNVFKISYFIRRPNILIPLALILTNIGSFYGLNIIWVCGLITLCFVKFKKGTVSGVILVVSLLMFACIQFPSVSSRGKTMDAVVAVLALFGLIYNLSISFKHLRQN